MVQHMEQEYEQLKKDHVKMQQNVGYKYLYELKIMRQMTSFRPLLSKIFFTSC